MCTNQDQNEIEHILIHTLLYLKLGRLAPSLLVIVAGFWTFSTVAARDPTELLVAVPLALPWQPPLQHLEDHSQFSH